MLRARRLSASVVVLLVLLVSGVGSVSCTDAPAAFCNAPSDCGADEVCAGGVCVPPSSLTAATTGDGEGEGEGVVAAEGEGEGSVAEGEGEGSVAEGEGEGLVVAEGEGEGAGTGAQVAWSGLPVAVERNAAVTGATFSGDVGCSLSTSPLDPTASISGSALQASPDRDTTYTLTCAASSTSGTVRVVFADGLSASPSQISTTTTVSLSARGPTGASCAATAAGGAAQTMSEGTGAQLGLFSTSFSIAATTDFLVTCTLAGVSSTSLPLQVPFVVPPSGPPPASQGFAWVPYVDTGGTCAATYDGPAVTTFVAQPDQLPNCDADRAGIVGCTSAQDGSPSTCSSCDTKLLACIGAAGAPQPVQQGSASTTSSQLTLTVPTSLTAGDLLVAVILQANDNGPLTRAGWTTLRDSAMRDGRFSVLTRVGDGSEGSAQAFDVATGGAVGILTSWHGSSATPVVQTSAIAVAQSTSANVVAPSVSIPAVPSLLLAAGGFDSCQGTATFTAPSSMTMIAQKNTNGCPAVFIARQSVLAVGDAGTRTFSSSRDARGAGASIVLR